MSDSSNQKSGGGVTQWWNASKLSGDEVKKILPHRAPFLFVDRIDEISDVRAVGVHKVLAEEPHFAGHFPGNPIMPGVLMVETMAQVAGIVALRRMKHAGGGMAYLAGLEKVRFRELVVPGDELIVETTLVKEKIRFHIADGIVRVGGKVVCEATVMLVLAQEKTS